MSDRFPYDKQAFRYMITDFHSDGTKTIRTVREVRRPQIDRGYDHYLNRQYKKR